MRWEPRAGLTVHARYDRASMTDDFTGYYDSDEQDVQVGASIPIGRITRLELLVDHLDRDYLDRVGSADTPSSDALLELSAEVDVWLFGNFGLTGRYQLERASAEPAGTLYTRHVVLVGAAARLGILD